MISPHLFDIDLAALPRAQCDILVIGTGIAGLSCALAAAPTSHVVLITKDTIAENNTAYAQGGVAAALGPKDSPELHASDTLAAGAGLSDEIPVSRLVNDGPDRIRELLSLGVRFDETNGSISLGKEAAHSSRRIAHAGGDATGREIHRTLAQAALIQVGIALRERTLLVDLLVSEGRAIGALLLHLDTELLSVVLANETVLASGGIGAVYGRTTNPLVATGDGLAAAYRAGAPVTDMEFIQFHPTALATQDNPLFLVSEAVRGEGALIRDQAGVAFMSEYHSSAELAPRDVVARAIYDRCQKTGTSHVELDCSPLEPERFEKRFPTILRTCLSAGVDPRREPVPVTPAAHYHMGGVRVDLESRTGLPGLWAAGECSCTGVHGANRLASNSLLEGLVFGSQTGISAAKRSRDDAREQLRSLHPPHPEDSRPSPSDEEVGAAIKELRELMWSKVGIVRTREQLEEAIAWIGEKLERHGKPTVSREAVELVNMLTVGWLAAKSALQRTESRGAHYRSDAPDRDDGRWQHHITNRLEVDEGETTREFIELQEVQHDG